MSNHCLDCGKEIPDNRKYCDYCLGKEIYSSEDSNLKPIIYSKNYPETVNKRDLRKGVSDLE